MQTESFARDQSSILSWATHIPGYLLQVAGLWTLFMSLIVGIQSAIKIWNYSPQDGSTWLFALFNYVPLLLSIIFARIGGGLFLWGRRSYAAASQSPAETEKDQLKLH